MSNSIEIDGVYNINTGRDKITITPDLARQIVALACDVSEEQQFPPEARITPAKLILNPSGTMHMAQSIDTTRQIGPGIVDARHSVNDHDCKKGTAHQSEMETAHAVGKEAEMEKAHVAEAAIHAELFDEFGCYKKSWDMARAILTAIRSGKVSGVWCDDYNLTLKLSAQELEIAALRARVAELEASIDAQMKSNERARARYADAHPQSNGRWPDRTDMVLWLMQAVDNAIKRECDAEEETARVAEERDRAVARLKEISEIDRAYQKLTAERDRALTDLAAEREHVCALVATSVEQETRIAVERERREKAEAWMNNLRDDAPRHADAFDKWLKTCENMAPLINRAQDAEKERDAARAEVAARESQLQDVANARREDQERIVQLVKEVAALKARKVKIGTITNLSHYSDSQAIAFHTGVQACADAIRAAGIEVSCE